MEEVDYFANLELGALISGHVGKRRAGSLLVEHLRLGSADTERSLQTSCGALGEPPPQVAEDHERKEQDQPRQHLGAEAAPARLRRNLDSVLLQLIEEGLPGLRWDRRRVGLSAFQGPAGAPVGRDTHGFHLVTRDVMQELRIVQCDGLLTSRRGQDEEQHDEDHGGQQPEVVAPRRRWRGGSRNPSISRRRSGGFLRHDSRLIMPDPTESPRHIPPR